MSQMKGIFLWLYSIAAIGFLLSFLIYAFAYNAALDAYLAKKPYVPGPTFDPSSIKRYTNSDISHCQKPLEESWFLPEYEKYAVIFRNMDQMIQHQEYSEAKAFADLLATDMTDTTQQLMARIQARPDDWTEDRVKLMIIHQNAVDLAVTYLHNDEQPALFDHYNRVIRQIHDLLQEQPQLIAAIEKKPIEKKPIEQSEGSNAVMYRNSYFAIKKDIAERADNADTFRKIETIKELVAEGSIVPIDEYTPIDVSLPQRTKGNLGFGTLYAVPLAGCLKGIPGYVVINHFKVTDPNSDFRNRYVFYKR